MEIEIGNNANPNCCFAVFVVCFLRIECKSIDFVRNKLPNDSKGNEIQNLGGANAEEWFNGTVCVMYSWCFHGD